MQVLNFRIIAQINRSHTPGSMSLNCLADDRCTHYTVLTGQAFPSHLPMTDMENALLPVLDYFYLCNGIAPATPNKINCSSNDAIKETENH